MNLFITLLIAGVSCFRHDFHVSITNAELNPQTSSLQVYMKLFTNDLESSIEQTFKSNLNLGTSSEIASADSLIANFVLRHFRVKKGDEKLKFQWIGKEIEQDIVFVYLEVPLSSDVKELTVSNTIFFDRFEDQSNIVNVEVNGQVQSAFLDRSSPVKTLRFD